MEESRMPAFSDFEEKMDVLDIIIRILRDHEERLSRLVDRLDDANETYEHLNGRNRSTNFGSTDLHGRTAAKKQIGIRPKQGSKPVDKNRRHGYKCTI
jgi:hypothetical protein